MLKGAGALNRDNTVVCQQECFMHNVPEKCGGKLLTPSKTWPGKGRLWYDFVHW